MEFRAAIKDIRQKVGLDQAAFGSLCGVSEKVIADIESGKDEPSDTLVELVKYRYSDYFFRQDDHERHLRRLSDKQGRRHTREGILELFEDRQTARTIIIAMAKMEKTDPGVLREIKGVIRMMQAEQERPSDPTQSGNDIDPDSGD